MKISYCKINQLQKLVQNSIVTIGNFDGFHKGHQENLKLINQPRNEKLCKIVISFYPFHQEYFQVPHFKRISFWQDQAHYLAKTGQVDWFILLKFDEDLRTFEAKKFIQTLKQKLNFSYLVIGKDFHFGYERKGNVALLKKLQKNYNYELILSKELLQNQSQLKISSSTIRELLASGNLTKVKQLLGRHYSIYAQVIKGQSLGRTLGFPTANLKLASQLNLQGVYLTQIKFKNQKYYALANCGFKPTVDNSTQYGIEVYILNFNEQIYFHRIEVIFIEKIRNEIKFKSVEELKENINKDLQKAKLMIEKIQESND